MKKSLALLLAASALATSLALPALARTERTDMRLPEASSIETPQRQAHQPLVLADRDDHRREGRGWFSLFDDDDDHGRQGERHHERHDDDDDDGRAGPNAAPAGSVAPPANGLFNNATPPRVQVN